MAELSWAFYASSDTLLIVAPCRRWYAFVSLTGRLTRSYTASPPLARILGWGEPLTIEQAQALLEGEP